MPVTILLEKQFMENDSDKGVVRLAAHSHSIELNDLFLRKAGIKSSVFRKLAEALTKEKDQAVAVETGNGMCRTHKTIGVSFLSLRFVFVVSPEESGESKLGQKLAEE